MTQSLEYHVRGLKCDAEGCGYSDMTIRLEDYPQYLNRPCPDCGANLLTEADLKATQAMIAACDWVNALGIPKGDGPKTTVRMHMDGSGIPRPEIIEP
jgi:hypothetical protein